MRFITRILVLCLTTSLFTGCGSGSNFASLLANAVNFIQTRPQVLPPVLVDRGDSILVDNSVTIIVNPALDIIPAQLPDITVLGFENDTDWDIYIKYYADDVLQGIYVYQGEALLLSYPCLEIVELISEDDIDPFTGELVESYDLFGFDYYNPEDFFCGDALILTFDPFSVSATAEIIDLWP